MSLLNRKSTKNYTLETAKTLRAHKFTCVGSDFLNRIETKIKVLIRDEIRALPSKGKTIK